MDADGCVDVVAHCDTVADELGCIIVVLATSVGSLVGENISKSCNSQVEEVDSTGSNGYITVLVAKKLPVSGCSANGCCKH